MCSLSLSLANKWTSHSISARVPVRPLTLLLEVWWWCCCWWWYTNRHYCCDCSIDSTGDRKWTAQLKLSFPPSFFFLLFTNQKWIQRNSVDRQVSNSDRTDNTHKQTDRECPEPECCFPRFALSSKKQQQPKQHSRAPHWMNESKCTQLRTDCHGQWAQHRTEQHRSCAQLPVHCTFKWVYKLRVVSSLLKKDSSERAKERERRKANKNWKILNH